MSCLEKLCEKGSKSFPSDLPKGFPLWERRVALRLNKFIFSGSVPNIKQRIKLKNRNPEKKIILLLFLPLYLRFFNTFLMLLTIYVSIAFSYDKDLVIYL